MIGKRDARLKQNKEKGEMANKEKEKKAGPEIVREMYHPIPLDEATPGFEMSN